jgi:probable HAF family extracellular repeat protein
VRLSGFFVDQVLGELDFVCRYWEEKMRKVFRVLPILFGASCVNGVCLAGASITVIGQEYHDRYSPGLTISADGSTVIGDFGTPGQRWTFVSGIKRIPPQAGTEIFNAFGVDANGDTIAGESFVSSQSGHYIPARWTVSGGVQGVGIPEGFARYAWGINADGSMVAGAYLDSFTSITHAFRWAAAAGVTELGPCYEVQGLSGDGSTIVGAQINTTSGRVFPVRWTSGGMQDLGLPLSLSNEGHAYGTNSDGSVVTGYYTADGHDDAFLWKPSTGLQALPHLPGNYYARAFAVGADGETVVGLSYQTFQGLGLTAFFWTPGTGAVDLGSFLASHGADMTGWSAIFGAYGVSADGSRIVGLGTYNGVTTAFVATIPSLCGSADFNCDGAVGTDADIEAFFDCIAGTCPPPPCTNNADFNADGAIATDADIDAFFRVLGGGPC